MSFITKQVGPDFDGAWQVGTFIAVDVPASETVVPGQPVEMKTLHTFVMESQHQSRLHAAAWCSFLNGGMHPDILDSALVEIRRQAADEVGNIIKNLRG